jgi:putative transposase
VRFGFIDEYQSRWPVSVMCRVLDVTRAGYYLWRKRPPSRRKKGHMELIEKIRIVHQESDRTYGSPRVTKQLQARGESVCVHTVARLMKKAEIRAKTCKAFVPRTTVSDPTHRAAENVLDRDFEAGLPNQKWACDITYIPTLQGWLYLAVVIDLCSRKIVGWSTSDRLQAGLAAEALVSAIQTRRPPANLLHHSDRGVQYTSGDYQSLLSEMKMTVSMSCVGQCWDNAVAESFFGTLKRERVNEMRYRTHEEARSNLFEWIECWYNRKRLHSSLGYLSPEAFEAQIN